MAYDEPLADRIRHVLADNRAITERRMFGGLCFLVNGRMCCGIVGDMLMARINKSEYTKILEEPHVRQMDFTGRPLSGFVYVEPEGIESARELRSWIKRGLEVAAQSDDMKKKRPGASRSPRAKQPAAKTTPVKTPSAKSAQRAGYSGTPLAKKLGIREDSVVLTLGAPDNYTALLAPLPDGVSITELAAGSRTKNSAARTADLVHIFTTSRTQLATHLTRLYSSIRPDAAVWVSWPKKASKVKTDITEDVIREVALPLGFVDVKVCAVDEVWSGLKLVIRVANRNARR
jgi:TfoX/Sxy family transcriptional regulator of competence genes